MNNKKKNKKIADGDKHQMIKIIRGMFHGAPGGYFWVGGKGSLLQGGGVNWGLHDKKKHPFQASETEQLVQRLWSENKFDISKA